ncbi:unnamed protein product [Spirodela intermedia]|uniref:HTH myb-type domain-containing protein n=1 Tax=Spirodela intermedia TaxID=51605 RepID=A0A7I8IG15_SPIIN|nr:unnamed protein product [Spirodela intermedia]CAA6656832.1 unnamed protein product [Spirodela intermedia]
MGFRSQSLRFEWRRLMVKNPISSFFAAGLNRTGKSCRLRWVNYLDPCLKRGRMTPQEEYLILELHSRWGNSVSTAVLGLLLVFLVAAKRTPARGPSENPEPCGAAMAAAVREKRDDGELEGYPMEQIWDEMVPPAEMTGLSRYEEFCEDEACNISCSPMSSPLWDCSRDTSFGKIDEEFKMFLPFSIPAWSMEENPADTQTLPVHLSPSNASSSTCGRCSIIR